MYSRKKEVVRRAKEKRKEAEKSWKTILTMPSQMTKSRTGKLCYRILRTYLRKTEKF